MTLRVAFIFFLCLIVNACSNTLKLETKSHFNIDSAFYTTWISGVKGGGSGTTFSLKITPKSSSQATEIKGLYFKNTYTKLTEATSHLFTGRILNSENNDGLISELSDRDDKPEQKSIDNPPKFQLEADDAVLHYTVNKKAHYFKIKLQEKESENLPM